MNSRNRQLAEAVKHQLFAFTPDQATPTTDFSVEPQYTLIARLPNEINQIIKGLSDDLRSRFPAHYYYSPEQYHLTIVPVPRFAPERLAELITPLLRGWRLPIMVHGLAANRFQTSAVLYPEDESLLPKRKALRQALGIAEQAYTIHRPVWEELLWVNFMRFTHPPEEELLAYIRQRADVEIGSFVLDQFELYETSTKTLDPVSSNYLFTIQA